MFQILLLMMIVWKGCLAIKLIRITAMWCPACLIMRPKLEEIKTMFPEFEHIEYDYDLDEEEISKYNVGNILPVFIVLDNDQEIARIVGEKTIEQISSVLRSCLK